MLLGTDFFIVNDKSLRAEYSARFRICLCTLYQNGGLHPDAGWGQALYGHLYPKGYLDKLSDFDDTFAV
ncbi:hypothetical protein D3C87_640850 [compost metagenome]